MSNLENLNGWAFGTLTAADAREVLGGAVTQEPRTIYIVDSILNGELIKDYDSDWE